MDVTYLSPTSVRIKGKQVTLLVNPDGKKKSEADGSLLLGNNRIKEFFQEGMGVLFQGPGEYEVKGVKITGFGQAAQTMYTIRLDGVSIFVGNTTSTALSKDILHEHDVVILIADDVLSQTIAGVLNAKVVIFVGKKANDSLKAFGKETSAVNKYSASKDKLPQETEFVLLG